MQRLPSPAFAAPILLVLSSCALLRPLAPDAGRVENGVYRNGYFGFTLPLPKGAIIKGPRDYEEIARTGARAVLDPADRDPKMDLPREFARAALLLFDLAPTTREADDEVFVTIAAVKVSPEDGMKDSADCLSQTIEEMTRGPARVEPKGPPYKIGVGGGELDAQDALADVGGSRIRITLSGRFLRGHEFILTGSYFNDAGRERFLAIARSLRF
ncbi:MAG: hypothetical protein ACHQ51_09245 [Elusimicrobiota bacterium]